MEMVANEHGQCQQCGGSCDAPRTLWACELCGRGVCTACLADREDGLFCTSCAVTLDQFGDEEALMAELPADLPAQQAAWMRLKAMV